MKKLGDTDVKITESELTVAIPTYGRDQVLINTIETFLEQYSEKIKIFVLDQSSNHDFFTKEKLSEWDKNGDICLKYLHKPSIPTAMNTALREAQTPIILFIDDDIIPSNGLIESHLKAYAESKEIWAVTGQVLQPGEKPIDSLDYNKTGFSAHLDFPFYSTKREWVRNVMAGNLSVRRDKAIEVGGFDENFVGVAYRFETEFCRRIWQYGGKVLFEPSASIRHLREIHGGTRRFGNHMTSLSPAHGVGDYYFAIKQGLSVQTLVYIIKRPICEVYSRFHLLHPWWIPVKLIGESLAFFYALILILSKFYKRN